MLLLIQLNDLFAGKLVRITTSGRPSTVEGTCKAVHATPGEPYKINFELEDGNRYGLAVETVMPDFVEGSLHVQNGVRREVHLI